MSHLSYKDSITTKELITARYMENRRKNYNLASSKENMEMLSRRQRDELSSALCDLKKEHDQMALESSNKTKEAELLKKKITMLELNSKKSTNEYKQKSVLLSTMQELIKEKKNIHSEEKQCNHLFKNKIDKLSKDILVIHQEINAIESQTKMIEAQIEFGKFNCQHIKTKVNTVHMKVTNQKEINERQYDDQELQRGYYSQIIQQKQTFIQSADERKVRQQIAAEKAKNNTNDLNEIIIRRKLLLLKMYNHYLAIKMNNQLQYNVEIEDSFTQIRDICIKDIADFILTKDKNYSLKQELVLQNEKRQQDLKKHLQQLEYKYQEILNQVVWSEDIYSNLKGIKEMKVNAIEEKDKESLMKESELVERLDTLLEVQKKVSLKSDKTIKNMNHLSHMFKNEQSSLSDNKSKTNPSEFNSANITINNYNTAFETCNNTGMVNIDNSQQKKESIDINYEEKAFNDYLSFLKNSYETFNRLFLCNSKHDFIKMMKAKGHQEQLLKKANNKPIMKLPLIINPYNNKSTLRKSSKHFLQSFSTTDVLKKTNQYDDDENISQREQQTQREIMRNFLNDIRKERDDYIQNLKPIP